MQITQVALAGNVDVDGVANFYADGLGFLRAGGMALSGPEVAGLQGLDVSNVDFRMRWLVDRTEFMQLELFEYTEPASRPRRRNWSPAEVGYNVVSVFVTDFDRALESLSDQGAGPIAGVLGAVGERRTTVRDPNRNIIEVMEKDLAPDVPAAQPQAAAALRAVRLTVLDLANATHYFTQTLGLAPSTQAIHDASHEQLWGLDGRTPELVTLTDGRIFLELAHYGEETQERPKGCRISDEGVLNIALATTDLQDYADTRSKVLEAGKHVVQPEAMLGPALRGCYTTSEQGHSVELFYCAPFAWADFGFVPVPPSED